MRHTPVLDRCGISLVHGISDNVANVIDACLGAVERTIPWGEGPDGRRRRPCRGQPLLLAGMPLGMYHCEDCGEMVMALASSTSSAEGSPARTSPSPGSGPASPGSEADSSSSSHESLSLFDPDGFSSRTYPVSSLATAVGTSESCLPRWPSSGTAWPGGLSTHASSECRSVAGECSSSEPSLTEILEPPRSVPERYSLSARAARGILRRAQKRGRILPPHLLDALETVAASSPPPSSGETSA